MYSRMCLADHDATEAVLKRKKDFYYEYTMDTFDENIAIATERNMFDNDLNGLLMK